MAYEVKMGYISGFNLVFTAYQPDGSARGAIEQPLPELAPGYYGGTPLTDLVAGDEVIAYILENVYWENDQVYVLTYGSLYWEGDRVFYEYEEDWVFSYDTADIVYEAVTSVGAVVGANEYTIDAADFTNIVNNIEIIITDGRTTWQDIDQTGYTSQGEPRQITTPTTGYTKTEMQEI